jgi:signal transduction histidine kinase
VVLTPPLWRTKAVGASTSSELGERKLPIRTEQDTSGAVLVAVRDTGPGLNQQSMERIFETFYTTNATSLDMGLSIFRSIIEAHGGRLWASTNEPRGAVFRFSLPPAHTDVREPIDEFGRGVSRH